MRLGCSARRQHQKGATAISRYGGKVKIDRNKLAKLAEKVAALKTMKTRELQQLYRDTFKEECRTNNVQHLRRRLAAKLQLDAIPPEEQERLAAIEPHALNELRKRVEQRRRAVEPITDPETGKARDPRLPPVGTVLTKRHKAEVYSVTVLDDGFEWQGKVYKSLSAVAFEITGTRWNGMRFFRLTKRKENTNE